MCYAGAQRLFRVLDFPVSVTVLKKCIFSSGKIGKPEYLGNRFTGVAKNYIIKMTVLQCKCLLKSKL